MLDHNLGNIYRFDALNFLDAYVIEHFKYDNEKFINITSMKRGRTMENDMKAMKASFAKQKRRNFSGGGLQKSKLVRYGTFITLVEIAITPLEFLAHVDKDG